MSIRGLIGGFLLLSSLGTTALAQRTTGTLSGAVTTEAGAPLGGVTVTLAAGPVMGTPSSLTDDQGFYRFVALPPGSYDLDFARPGFATESRHAVRVAVGATAEENVALRLSSYQERVLVVAESPVLDADSNQMSTHFDRVWVENAPTKRFSFFDLVNAAPGVGPSTYSSAQSTVFGASTNDSSYQLDGTDFTAPSTGNSWPLPNPDAIEEVEVLSLGAPSEYGNVQGAVFNVVTRQGSNTFHGAASLRLQDQSLTAHNTTPEEDDGLPFHRESFVDTTARVGGPLVKDRLWFFASYQYQEDSQSDAGTSPEYPSRFSTHRLFAKLNLEMGPRNRLMLAYHDDYTRAPFGASALNAPSTVLEFHGHNPSPNLTFTSLFTDRTYFEARVSGFYGTDETGPYLAGEPRTKPVYRDLDTGQLTGGTPFWSEGSLWRTGASAKLSHFADRFLGGSHDFRFGLQYSGGGSDYAYGYNDFIYTYEGVPAFGTTRNPFHQGGRMEAFGLFADDAFRVHPRLTLNLGLRFDHSRASFPAYPVLDGQGNETALETAAVDDVFDWNVVSPRVGAAFHLTSDGHTVLKAHYGRYYRGIVTSEFESAGPSIAPAYFFSGTYDAAGDPEGLELASDNSQLRVDPGFKDPWSDQIVVSLERRLRPGLGVLLGYVHKRGGGNGAWRDVGGQYAPAVYSDTAGTDASGREIAIEQLVSAPETRGFLLTSPTEMFTRYDGFLLQVTRPMQGRFQLTGSLVLSRARGRLGSSLNGPRAEQQSIAQGFGQNPNDFVNSDGRLVEDRPVVAKIQLVYRLPAGFLASASFVHQTGRPWGRLVNASAAAGLPTFLLAEEITGARRVADWNVLDLGLQKEFEVRRRATLSLLVEALNLTNSGAYEGVGRLGTSSSFGKPSGFIPPRRAIVGLKVLF